MSLSERDVRRALDRLDTEDIVDILDATPEHHRAVPRPRWRGPARQTVITMVATVLATVIVVGYVVHAGDWWRPNTRGLPARPTVFADGHYKFLTMQRNGSGRPVGYDPCFPVPVRVNPADGPKDARQQVRQAVRIVDRASGLRLAYAGTTTATAPSASVPGVVVSFTTSSQQHDLAGRIVARGGSFAGLAGTNGLAYYLGGTVRVDWPDFNAMSTSSREAVLLHEFGHVVGLDHVTDRDEIMYAHGSRSTSYQHGDLTGLAKLGRLPCQTG